MSKEYAETLEFIAKYQAKNQAPPSIREIGEALNINSTSTVDYQLKRLEENGLIARRGSLARGIMITPEGRQALDD